MSAFAGTSALVRLVLRRDRVRLPAWVLWVAAVPTVLLAPATDQLYPTAAARAQYAADSIDNPTFRLLYGHIYDTSLGGLIAWRASFGVVILALLTILTVVRHTRTEEEAGRRELLGATVVGRHAGLAAALVVAVAANVVVGSLVAAGMMANDQAAVGSVAYGLSIAAVGTLFGAVAGLTAQVTQGAAAARGIAIVVLGASYLLRAVGDVGGTDSALSWLSWWSPLGWAQRVHPYGGERWWILAVLVVVIAVVSAAAFALSARRDLGAGLLAGRRGPAAVALGLRTPLALAWRLHRGALVAWTAGLAAVGAVLGGAASTAEDLFDENDELRDVFERVAGSATLTDVFLAGTFSLVGLFAAVYAVQATLRLRSEETAMRAEPVLAAGVRRSRWLASHLVFAAAGPVVLLAAAGIAGGLAFGLSGGDLGRELPRLLAAALIQVPAVWLLAAIAVALHGVAPRFATAAWGAIVVCVMLGQVAAILDLGQAVLDVSPFTHVPKLPGGDLTALPLLVLTGFTAVLTAAGVVGFRTRDVS